MDYQNPKLVVGAIVEHEGKVLLCRRGIEPQRGKWTVPAGFMEMGETTAQGAARETMEEAAAAVDIQSPFVHFDIPGISQARAQRPAAAHHHPTPMATPTHPT